MTGSYSTLEIGADAARADNIHGYGFNCITGGIVVGAHCVNNIVKLNPQPRAQDNLVVKVIKSSADYNSFLSASASVSASGLSWSATASMSYASQNAATDTSMTYIALRDLRSADVFMDLTKATIDPTALSILAGANGPANFIAKYGTHCVIGVSYGGSFTGYIRIDTSSAEHKEQVAAAMSVSVSGFGMGGSVNAAFSTGLASISTNYSLTANASSLGLSVPGTNHSDPDGLLTAAQAATLVANGNVSGSAVAFICVTWDQFPEIQAALDKAGQSDALSLTTAMANLAQLSVEYQSLNYIFGTCRGMMTSGAFAIPAQRSIASKLMTAAAGGQHAIQSLSMTQVQSMSQTNLQALLISNKLNIHLNPITHNAVLVSAYWYTDAAFSDWGDHSTTIKVTLNEEYTVVTVDHHNGDASLLVDVGQDGQGYYLQTHWTWNPSNTFASPRLDIGGATIDTTPVPAAWTGAAWNRIQANLIDYNS